MLEMPCKIMILYFCLQALKADTMSHSECKSHKLAPVS